MRKKIGFPVRKKGRRTKNSASAPLCRFAYPPVREEVNITYSVPEVNHTDTRIFSSHSLPAYAYSTSGTVSPERKQILYTRGAKSQRLQPTTSTVPSGNTGTVYTRSVGVRRLSAANTTGPRCSANRSVPSSAHAKRHFTGISKAISIVSPPCIGSFRTIYPSHSLHVSARPLRFTEYRVFQPGRRNRMGTRTFGSAVSTKRMFPSTGYAVCTESVARQPFTDSSARTKLYRRTVSCSPADNAIEGATPIPAAPIAAQQP